MSYLFDINDIPSIPVYGTSSLFPIHRIYCVGQNYIKHVEEMGAIIGKSNPFFFIKPADAIFSGKSSLPFPLATKNLQHEVELVVAIGRKGEEIEESEALEYVFGYAVGLDLTRRDLQIEAKKKGLPWATAKSFDNSAPCSFLHQVSSVGHLEKGEITLSVNDEIRQKGDISEMIWPVKKLISILSRFFELCPGDLIFTGTPAGVSSLKRGDKIEATIENLNKFILKIV